MHQNNGAIALTSMVSWYTLATRAAAFVPSPLFSSAAGASLASPPSQRSGIDSALLVGHADENATPDAERRRALRKISASTFLLSSGALSLTPRDACAASSDLFKPNPLTNPILEQLRIWNQDETDNIRYGGELESGSAKPKAFDQYVQLLQPILTVERDLGTVNELIKSDGLATKEDYIALFEKVGVILSRPLFDKINFKRSFNAFGDNIYYSDPDRANLYLGGGATPKTTQSLAYLLRNDVLTNVEDMRAEVQYLLKEIRRKGDGEAVAVGEGGLELEDILRMSRMARDGMAKYLDLVPPDELEVARAKFKDR